MGAAGISGCFRVLLSQKKVMKCSVHLMVEINGVGIGRMAVGDRVVGRAL